MVNGLILDTETTGLKLPQVIELAYMPVDQHGVICDPLVVNRFKPNKDIEQSALRVHCIPMSELESMPDTKDIEMLLPILFSDVYIIGHFIDYDINAINNSIGGAHQFKSICTKRLAYNLFKPLKSYSLVNIVKDLAPDVAEQYACKAHSADADVCMAFELLALCIDKIQNQTGKRPNLDDLFDLSNRLGFMPHNQYT